MIPHFSENARGKMQLHLSTANIIQFIYFLSNTGKK